MAFAPAPDSLCLCILSGFLTVTCYSDNQRKFLHEPYKTPESLTGRGFERDKKILEIIRLPSILYCIDCVTVSIH